LRRNNLPSCLSGYKSNQTKDSLIVEGFRFSDPSNSSPSTIGYPFDGKLITRDLGKGKIMKAVIEWSEDGKKLTRNSSYYQSDSPDMVDYKTREIWNLSEDGELLTLTRTFIRSSQLPLTMQAVYDKK
jgi:hypothetical protein